MPAPAIYFVWKAIILEEDLWARRGVFVYSNQEHGPLLRDVCVCVCVLICSFKEKSQIFKGREELSPWQCSVTLLKNECL